jgi:hypothetical protein
MVNQVNLWTIIYSVVFSVGAIGSFFWVIVKRIVNHVIEEHIDLMREELASFNRKFDRVEYALYNNGQTGLINKVDALIQNQQIIKTDVEVMKAKYENL